MYEMFFNSGSSAIKFYMINSKLNKTTIFIPEYICKSLVDTLEKIKIKIIFYKVKINLSTDWEDLKKKIKKNKNNKPFTVLFVNYFGSDIEKKKFIKLKKVYKFKLIEDNSHGLYINSSEGFHKDIDLSFSSPKKIIPKLYYAGVALHKNKNLINFYKNLGEQKLSIFYQIKTLTKNFLKKFGLFNFIFNIKNNFSNINSNTIDKIRKIDLKSFKIYKNLNKKKIYKQKNSKIDEYDKLLKNFSYNKFQSNTNSNLIPWYYVCIAKNYQEKLKIRKYCKKKNIRNFDWPELPKKLKNIRTNMLYKKLICLSL